MKCPDCGEALMPVATISFGLGHAETHYYCWTCKEWFKRKIKLTQNGWEVIEERA